MSQEKRRYPRFKVKVPVELHLSASAPPQRTSVDEISLCGCYIETMFTFDPGTKLGLVFSLNEERISVQGIVVNRYPQVGNGIDFVEISPEDRAKLSEFLSKLPNEQK